jgi:hypothetical protein
MVPWSVESAGDYVAYVLRGLHLLKVVGIDDAAETDSAGLGRRKVAHTHSGSRSQAQHLIGQLAQLHDVAESLRIGRAGRFDNERGEARQCRVDVCCVHQEAFRSGNPTW